MAIKQVPWVGGYARHDSVEVSIQEPVNYYVENLPADGTKVQKVLRMIPGTKIWKDLAISGVCRGMFTASDGSLFVCYGPTIYKVASDGSATEIINIGTSVAKVSWASDAFHVVVCEGSGMWAINLTTLEAKSCNISFLRPTQVAYFGYRFIAICDDESYSELELDEALDLAVRNKNKIFYSNPSSSTDLEWPALNYEVASTSGDPISGIGVTASELWVFGTNSYEPWRYTGDATAPFERAQGAGGWIGAYSKDSICAYGNQLLWLGSGSNGYGQIWTNGSTYEPVKISTPSIDQLLARTRDKGITLTDAVGTIHGFRGHIFYVLTFIQGDFSLAYDLTTSEWAKRSSRNPLLGTEMRWSYMFAANAYDKTFVADERNPYIMQLSNDCAQEYDGSANPLAIRRVHTGPVLWNQTSPMTINMFRIDMTTGVGIQTGQGVDPMMQIRVYTDGGHVAGPERLVPIGKVGQYRSVAEVRRLGTSRAFNVESVISDNVRADLLSAVIDVEASSRR